MISIKKFLQEDYSKVVGIYFDGNKIFLSRKNDETIENNFEINLNEKISFAEQLAEKVLFLCNKQGWNTSKVALCLREEDSTTLQIDLDNIPKNKLDDAVKSWAIAQAGEKALYTFTEINGEFWTETISKKSADNFISAFKKFSMNLCVMTSLIKNQNKSAEIIKIAEEKKSPNLLKNQFANWNFKKIFSLAIGIFLFATSIIFGKLYYDWNVAANELEIARKKLAAMSDLIEQKEIFDANVAESKKINQLLASQLDKNILNDLIKIGQIADKKISLTKINYSTKDAEVEGITESSTDVKNYLGKFKNYISRNAKLEKISTENDKVIFKIRIDFTKK